jgi:cell division protein FtsZ
MGGGTGTGAAPIIARPRASMGILTVGVVTKPFQFEGGKPHAQAEGHRELQKLRRHADHHPEPEPVPLANEKTTFADAFAMADEVLYSGRRGITDLMVMPGLINLDFADVRAVMQRDGQGDDGHGRGHRRNARVEAAEAAIANPLLDEIDEGRQGRADQHHRRPRHDPVRGRRGGANRIRERSTRDANIIFGALPDDGGMGLAIHDDLTGQAMLDAIRAALLHAA